MKNERDNEAPAMLGLRERAERSARVHAEIEPAFHEAVTFDATALLHDLKVHQIELEMQNEELRRAHLALEAERARYFDLYDMAPIGYVTLDGRGIVTEANLTVCAMLGAPRRAVVGSAFTKYIFRDDQDAYYLHRKELSNTEQRHAIELRMTRASSDTVWMRIEETVVREAEGSSVHRVVLSDVSDRKRTEEILIRTDRLASIGLLAAGVAHEINGPLAYVLMNVEALSKVLPTLSSDPSRRAASTFDEAIAQSREALDGARRIAEITSALRTFARSDAGSKSAVDIHEAISHALKMASAELSARATLVTSFGVLRPVLATEGKLAQVFLNLLINAAHSIPEGDIENNRVVVRTWLEDDMVVAEVEDSGAGIPPEILSRIFDPFFTTKPVGKGSGLGLSMTTSIVRELDGEIHVESEVGKGTRFVVRLPAHQGAKGSNEPSLRARSAILARRGRILVVDDEAGIIAVIVRALRDAYDIVGVGSGQEARELLACDEAFDLILCDVMMPGVTGIELHAGLVERNSFLAQRTFFMSGGVYAAKAVEYMSRVDTVPLEKPFSSAKLCKFVERALEQRERRA